MKRWLVVALLVSFFLGCYVSTVAAVELSVIHCWDGARTEWVDELLRAFEERNPDIGVTGVFAGTCATRLPERLILSIASGAPFDVAMVGPGTLASLANQGELLPLDDWLRAQRISRDLFLPSELRGAQWEGRLYGLPFTTGDGNLLFYNRRIFEEVGLNPDRPPTTFAELDEISKKLYRVEDGVATLIPFSFAYQHSQAPLWWLYAGGGQFVSEDGSEIHFTDGRALEIMDFLRNYINQRVGGPQNIRGTRREFLASQIAMFTRGNHVWGEVKAEDSDFPLGVGLAPKHPDSQWTGATRGGWYYAVPSSTPHREEAMKLLYWLTVPKESAGYFVLRQGRPSPVIAYNRDRLYYQVNPYFGVIVEAVMNNYPIANILGYDEAAALFNSEWTRLLRDHSLNPRAVLDDVARRVATILREAKDSSRR